ncbi:Uma2 family endonuclease [candidate division KSB1 bacterium]|nr:Uma2 family endonuclease [candidate division KSB1 bacterium]
MTSDLLTRPLRRQTPMKERFTYSEFCSRVREQKADLINGEMFMASPATIEHEDFVHFLVVILRSYVKEKDLGLVVGSRVAMKLSDEDAPEPDVMFIRKERLHLLQSTEILGPADLAIEVISPGSRRLDSVDKKELYASFGVPEYWLIDLSRQQAHFWRNQEGEWKDMPVDGNGIFRSSTVPGFWLRVDWLFASQSLNELEVLSTILASDASNP